MNDPGLLLIVVAIIIAILVGGLHIAGLQVSEGAAGLGTGFLVGTVIVGYFLSDDISVFYFQIS